MKVDFFANLQQSIIKSPLIILVVFALTQIFLIYKIFVNHQVIFSGDCALFFECAKRLLLGQLPYVDFIEHNPPLIYYFNLIPAWFHLQFNLSADLVFLYYMVIITTLIFIFSYKILVNAKLQFSIYQTFLIAIVLFNITVLETYGQREHIIVLLIIPFMIVRSLRFENYAISKLTAILAGILAGIGLSIKPWYTILILFYDITWAIITKQYKLFLAKEAQALILTIFVYILHFLFLPRIEIGSYFNFDTFSLSCF